MANRPHPHKQLEEINRVVMQGLVDLLFFKYHKARESIISYESNVSKMPAYAFTELRDFIDHMYLALSQDQQDQIPHHLEQAEEHLRRAVAEPYQGVVQDEVREIGNLFNTYNKYWFKKMPFLEAKTLSYDEYYSSKREIHDLLERGRRLKSCNIWSDEFDEAIEDCFLPAYQKCISLKQKIIGSLAVSKSRTEKVVLALVIGIFLLFFSRIFDLLCKRIFS